jgi:hypothetical protein
MKRKVYTDGNGSTLIMVDGLGQYVPASEFISLQAERDALKADRDAGAKDYCKLMERHDALAVQIEQLRNYVIALTHADDIGYVENYSEIKGEIEALIAERDAAIAEQTIKIAAIEFKAAWPEHNGKYFWMLGFGNEYANQIRQAAKGQK